VLDPKDLYEVDADLPDLTGVTLLHQLDGFVDAGSAGRLVAEHLLSRFEHRVIARFDVDRLVDYRARRPTMTFSADRWESYHGPELQIHLMHDADGTGFLLLTGPEPDHGWEGFIAAVRELVERLGVTMTVGFHGIPMGVPHTRPLGVTAHATRSGLVSGYAPIANRLLVPANIGALLEFRLGEAGHDAIGFAAHVPHYVAQTTYPAAGVTLLGAIAKATGLKLPDDMLQEAARRARVEIDRQVNESDEVADVVHALEQQYDSFAEGADRESLLVNDIGEMPTADELGSQFERFLAEQQGFGDPQD
jgi:predicted ATP-grasp superfamily ATP-dependent carboligase